MRDFSRFGFLFFFYYVGVVVKAKKVACGRRCLMNVFEFPFVFL